MASHPRRRARSARRERGKGGVRGGSGQSADFHEFGAAVGAGVVVVVDQQPAALENRELGLFAFELSLGFGDRHRFLRAGTDEVGLELPWSSGAVAMYPNRQRQAEGSSAPDLAGCGACILAASFSDDLVRHLEEPQHSDQDKAAEHVAEDGEAK